VRSAVENALGAAGVADAATIDAEAPEQ
jgi:hypothetical protein